MYLPVVALLLISTVAAKLSPPPKYVLKQATRQDIVSRATRPRAPRSMISPGLYTTCTAGVPSAGASTVLYSYYAGYTYPNSDIYAVTSEPSANACLTRCENTAGCVGIEFATVSKLCAVKNSLSNQGNFQAAANHDVYVMTSCAANAALVPSAADKSCCNYFHHYYPLCAQSSAVTASTTIVYAMYPYTDFTTATSGVSYGPQVLRDCLHFCQSNPTTCAGVEWHVDTQMCALKNTITPPSSYVYSDTNHQFLATLVGGCADNEANAGAFGTSFSAICCNYYY